MRIAFDYQIFAAQQYGGISRYICSLAKGLSRYSGVSARVFAPLHVNNYLLTLPRQVVCGQWVPRIPRTGRLVRAFNQVCGKSAVDRFNADIVHETYYSPDAYAPPSALRVITVYDMIHELFSTEFPSSDKTTEWKRVATQRADHIICISENTRTDLLRHFNLPENKVSVIYLGYDALTIPLQTDKADVRPFLLYVGQRTGYKNFERFIRAYGSSAWLCNSFDVVCFGGGEFSNGELELFRGLGLSDNRVRYLSGDDSKLALSYRDAAVFIYPSVYEGFGIPPLEAMSMDCPVVCSNTSSIPEVVGDAAEYFDPYNLESIRLAMENVLSSRSRHAELVCLGRLRSTKFSWDRCVDETLAVYKGLM